MKTIVASIVDPQISRLMDLYDEPFVVKAYEVMLNRAPDEGGLANYLAKVRAGVHRGHVILEMAESPEGRLKRRDLRAIRASFGRCRDADPGFLKQTLCRMTGLSIWPTARQYRALENQFHVFQLSIGKLAAQQSELLKLVQQFDIRIGRSSTVLGDAFAEQTNGCHTMRLSPGVARKLAELKAVIALKRAGR
jgi:hypothetical protein